MRVAQRSIKGTGFARGVYRFIQEHTLAAFGGFVVLSFLLAGILAPYLAPYDPLMINIRDRLVAPGSSYWLGTDNQGRDMLSRILFGARMSLYISLVSVSVASVLGVLLGTLAGYYRHLDALIMRLMDVFLAFPGIIVALTIIAILGRSVNNVVIAIAIYQIPQFARLAHGLTLSLKETLFVEAAVAAGESDGSILSRYILPNYLAPIVVQMSLLFPGAILTAASLSFLGLGVPPPTPEWGSMLQNSLQWARLAPHVMIVPGLALMLVVFGFNVFGDGLRDAMDPRMSRK